MSDDIEVLFPQRDAHADKARMDAREWRKKYRKIDFVHWNAKQWTFINSEARFLYLRAANQIGKSTAAAGLVTYTAIGEYPTEYQGWKPKLQTDGAYSVIIWVLSTTGQMLRDGLQTKLLGDVASGQAGTGLIPKENIISIQSSRGIAGAVDFCTIRMADGSTAKISFKTYEQGRAAVQAEPVNLVVLDELLTDYGIFTELQARLTSTHGVLRMAATEREQTSDVAQWFEKNQINTDTEIQNATLFDAEHMTKEEQEAEARKYTPGTPEYDTRVLGLPFRGGGGVFTRPLDQIVADINPSKFPPYYKYLIGLDFSHFGQSEQSSQFAAVFLAYDPMTEVVYIFDAFKMRGQPELHAARILNAGGRGMPCAWPHDGNQGMATGDTIAALYKKAGLRMLPEHARFPTGGYNFESGIFLMESMFAKNQIKVARQLVDWFAEYTGYERDEKGQVIRKMDDLMSATRVGIMMLRKAKLLEECETFPVSNRRSNNKVAAGDDWDPWGAARIKQ